MKTFEVTAIVKGEKVTTTVQAIGGIEASREARQKLGYEMRGQFFPLHWSEIKQVIELR